METYDITDVESPVSSNIEFTGEIALSAAYFMPKWYKPQTKALFSWSYNNSVRNNAAIENGKTYTISDIAKLLEDHLGKRVFDNLFHNNNRVTLILNKDMGVKNVMFCNELIDKYKLPRLTTAQEALLPRLTTAQARLLKGKRY